MKSKVIGSFSIFKYFQTVNFVAQNFCDKYMSSVFFLAFFDETSKF